jgi:homoserine O-acetyltransferase
MPTNALQYFTIEEPFELEAGQSLPNLTIAYTTQGVLNEQKDNAIWVFHAFTGDANPDEWWKELMGPGKVIDPAQHYIICANMPGSCYGSTFAKTLNPATGQAYGSAFPDISIRDMIQAFQKLSQHLEINQVKLGIGGSMGGQQLLEWAVQCPSFFEKICVMASNARHSAWGIAFNEAQRMALLSDPSLYDGQDNSGRAGLAAARAVAMLSYRNYQAYQITQTDEDESKLDAFRAASYQQYQGEKLFRRFDPLSYLTLSKAMDSHNVGRGRGGAEAALSRIQSDALIIGIQSDVLFPVAEQSFVANHIPKARLEIIESKFGHDGFLVESDAIIKVLEPFMANRFKLNTEAKYIRGQHSNGFGQLNSIALPGTEIF